LTFSTINAFDEGQVHGHWPCPLASVKRAAPSASNAGGTVMVTVSPIPRLIRRPRGRWNYDEVGIGHIWYQEFGLSIQKAIEDKLTAHLSPERLVVINESHLHAGHHHVHEGRPEQFEENGETHFRVRIVSKAFEGMSRIDRHRTVNTLLADELKGGVHALAIEASAPGEPTRW